MVTGRPIMPGQFAASCGTPGQTARPGAATDPPGQHRHATPQPRRPASDTGGPLGGWPPPGARCAARATRSSSWPEGAAPPRPGDAMLLQATKRPLRRVRTPEPTQPTIMPGPHAPALPELGKTRVPATVRIGKFCTPGSRFRGRLRTARNRQGDMGGLIRQRTFRSLRCVIPGLAAGVAGWVADQVNGRRRPVFGPPDRVPVADDPIGTRR